MSDDDFDEGLWIYAGPPPDEPEGPGCLGVLALFVVGYGVAASGVWAPLLVLFVAWKLVLGTR